MTAGERPTYKPLPPDFDWETIPVGFYETGATKIDDFFDYPTGEEWKNAELREVLVVLAAAHNNPLDSYKWQRRRDGCVMIETWLPTYREEFRRHDLSMAKHLQVMEEVSASRR